MEPKISGWRTDLRGSCDMSAKIIHTKLPVAVYFATEPVSIARPVVDWRWGWGTAIELPRILPPRQHNSCDHKE